MAGMMDRIRNRMQGQRPVGAAQGMPMGAQIPDIGGGQYGRGQTGRPVMYSETGEVDLNMLAGAETPEVAEARRLGERLGAESILDAAGLSPLRRAEMENNGRIMNPQRLNEATQTLLRYQGAKSSVNDRVVKAQQWWKLKNWEQIREDRGVKGATTHPSNTGWLWNCIVGKHADAIDSYPEPVILPRMQDDEEEAQRLSKIVPVVMEMNEFEETYSDCAWQKMQEGTGVYGIFWNNKKLNGLGDIDIKQVNILNLYWEPGIKDIQDSRNVFYVSYEEKKDLEKAYPELEGKLTTSKISMKEYRTDDHIDMSNKAIVIDWYYKTTDGDGQTILHYCKYVNETCLYSSEEEGEEEGYYADGMYPFVMDALFPVEGSPAGYGYIDIAKDTQSDIDTLSQAMVQNAVMRATPRFFSRKDGTVNEEEFSDWSKPIIHVGGNLGQDTLFPVSVAAMGGDAHNMLAQKIDEIKFVTGNTDVNNGGVPSGVTAASAIAALKEDSGRSSKDSTKAAYRSYRKIVLMVIERIRQFYGIPRQFRILGEDGKWLYTSYENSALQPQIIQNELPNVPMAQQQQPGMRLPVFDVEIRAQRENAYTKMSQNELALQFFSNGMLNPQLTDQALIVLDMMDFRGKDKLRQQLQRQGTMQQVVMKLGQIAMAMAQKYQPELVPQIGAAMQGILEESGGGTMQMPGGKEINPQLKAPADNMSAPNPNENAIVSRARERAANATRPDA